jgi:hypothetical protein
MFARLYMIMVLGNGPFTVDFTIHCEVRIEGRKNYHIPSERRWLSLRREQKKAL